MAQEAWRAYLELALGATEATRKKATKTVKRLAGKSAVSADQLQSMVEDVLRTSTANRDALTKLVRYELDRALGKVGLATTEDVAALTARVRELEAKLRAASVADGPTPADKLTQADKLTSADEPTPAVESTSPAEVPAAVAAPGKIARKAVKKAVPVVDSETLAGLADTVPVGDAVPGVDTEGSDVSQTASDLSAADLSASEPGGSEPAVPPARKAGSRKRGNSAPVATPATIAKVAPTRSTVAATPAPAPVKKVAAARKLPVKRAPNKRTSS